MCILRAHTDSEDGQHILALTSCLTKLGGDMMGPVVRAEKAAFLPHPSDTAKGQLSFAWVGNGAFLRMRLGDDAIWLISRDDSQPDDKVFSYDSGLEASHEEGGGP